MPGTALNILSKATRDAQDISNQLGLPANSVQVASTSTSDPVARILSVIADLQQAYDAFGSERGSFTASPRIDKALMNAIDYANLAAALAAQNQIVSVKSSLQRAIDYLELVDVLMLYGDVTNPVD